MAPVTNYRAHTGAREDKHYKTTLFEGNHLMVGVNCLEPGQEQISPRAWCTITVVIRTVPRVRPAWPTQQRGRHDGTRHELPRPHRRT